MSIRIVRADGSRKPLKPSRRRRSRASEGGERGATLIEFALISSLMFAMLFGILSYGEILADQVQLRHRVSEISRLVSLGEGATDRELIFKQIRGKRLAGFMNINGCAPEFEADGFAGPAITITARYQYQADGRCRVMPEVFTGLLPEGIGTRASFTVAD
ncbi:TadE/TadG family type IV pilus assembly protein [Zavarzinia sp.]|uniref:TadE/TadG family type IV pilus assembly protein n=1 Tax=Zavarzinia sp. TaxID=2027920 RepID=UPI003BB5AD41